MKGLLYLSLPLLIADQATKWLAIRYLKGQEPVSVIPGFFDLVYVQNTGAAFGMAKGQNLLFVTISVIALSVMAWMFIKNSFHDGMSRLGGVLLIPGILGNLTDRLVHGFVVDFLDFYISAGQPDPRDGHHWPAFNIADVCICVAVGCFLISSWKESKKIKPVQST